MWDIPKDLVKDFLLDTLCTHELLVPYTFDIHLLTKCYTMVYHYVDPVWCT